MGGGGWGEAVGISASLLPILRCVIRSLILPLSYFTTACEGVLGRGLAS